MTWNMQGASGNKWTSVNRMAAGGSNYRRHDVIALQESGPAGSLPGTRVRLLSVTDNLGQTYAGELRRWQAGSGSRGHTVYITWMNTDPTGNRNNVAIVTEDEPTNITLFRANNTNGNPGMRPALGVDLPDGSRFYSFHASSNGDNRSNDAQNLVDQIHNDARVNNRTYAILGDFNRRPEYLTAPAGSAVFRTGQGTQQSGGELDYMVSNDTNMAGWTGRRLNGGESDHYAVEFAFRANAMQNMIFSEKYPDQCINGRADGWSQAAWCDTVGYESIVSGGFQNKRFASTNLCLDAQRGGTANGTNILTYDCKEGVSNQQFQHISSTGELYQPSSGKCIDMSGVSEHWLVLWDCNQSLGQAWVYLALAPYVWTYTSLNWSTLHPHDEL
ncbi:ricin-type beta-trefoil lectin domain protein [Streptomyces yangpuensis]|uniref:ricin-type beta-trefoil lectin domain protein n=1 Tax=Streptomyces yangpuensis TaxID=1648182 RepID=UPI003624C378